MSKVKLGNINEIPSSQNSQIGNGGELHQTAEGDTPVLTTSQGGPVADDQDVTALPAPPPTNTAANSPAADSTAGTP